MIKKLTLKVILFIFFSLSTLLSFSQESTIKRYDNAEDILKDFMNISLMDFNQLFFSTSSIDSIFSFKQEKNYYFDNGFRMDVKYSKNDKPIELKFNLGERIIFNCKKISDKNVIKSFYFEGGLHEKIIVKGQNWNCLMGDDDEYHCVTLGGDSLFRKNYRLYHSNGKRIVYHNKTLTWYKSGKRESKSIYKNEDFKAWYWFETGKLDYKW